MNLFICEGAWEKGPIENFAFWSASHINIEAGMTVKTHHNGSGSMHLDARYAKKVVVLLV